MGILRRWRTACPFSSAFSDSDPQEVSDLGEVFYFSERGSGGFSSEPLKVIKKGGILHEQGSN